MSLASKKDVMDAIYPLFAKSEKMVLLVGDMGFSVLDRYFDNFKERVFNIGICEQAMIGMAAGMFMAGLEPIVYSQVPFLTMRAFEQIRYDLNEHNLGVKLIGVGADNYFEKLGRSHCIDDDDIELIKILKNILLLSPTKDSIQADIKRLFEYKGPVYVRCY